MVSPCFLHAPAMPAAVLRKRCSLNCMRVPRQLQSQRVPWWVVGTWSPHSSSTGEGRWKEALGASVMGFGLALGLDSATAVMHKAIDERAVCAQVQQAWTRIAD